MVSDIVIETKNLSKKYKNGILALQNLNLKIPKGNVIGYVGPNGAGKTTTIKILTNLLKPTTGQAYINGIDVNKNPKKALLKVGALIEWPGIYGYLTPNEMLTYFGKVHRMKNIEIDQRIDEVLNLIKLTDWKYSKIGSFSTGMHRRLQIAKAILHNPEILILDEPVLGLDPQGIRDIRELIKQLRGEGMTIFLSSHLLQEVSETCDSIIFLDRGIIVASDSVKDIATKTELRMINVRFLNPLSDKDIEKIGSISFIDTVEILESNVRIGFDGKPLTSSQILSKLVALDFKIVSYAPESLSLEDYYVSVMSNERRVQQ